MNWGCPEDDMALNSKMRKFEHENNMASASLFWENSACQQNHVGFEFNAWLRRSIDSLITYN